MSETGNGGFNRIQLSGDTAAEWEKNNPACLPRELIVVEKPNGHVCIKMNRTQYARPYSELPVLWDEDVAERLESDLSESQKAVSDAKQSETNAKEYAKNAADSAAAVSEKAAAIMECTGFKYVLNANDGGIDIVDADEEEQ